jgi:hypothetical protein
MGRLWRWLIGEFSGSHAEYIALERKLANQAIAGATVYRANPPTPLKMTGVGEPLI